MVCSISQVSENIFSYMWYLRGGLYTPPQFPVESAGLKKCDVGQKMVESTRVC
jgi:hypothetical protein